MTTHYRIAVNSIHADEDRQAMARAGLQDVVSVPHPGNIGIRSSYLTFGKGEIKPGVLCPCAGRFHD